MVNAQNAFGTSLSYWLRYSSWKKIFLQIKDQDIFKAFERLQEEFMLKTIDHLAEFIALGYISRAKYPEVRVHLYKQKNASCEPTMEPFCNHILRTFH